MPKDDIGGGNIIGKVAIIETAKKYVCGDHVYRLVQKENNDAKFLYFLINCPTINRRLRSLSNGTSQLGLGKSDLMKQKIYLPPIHEQESISRILNEAQQEIALLKNLTAQFHVQKRGLMQNLLTGNWRTK